jgi:HEXXH motif-containing protein
VITTHRLPEEAFTALASGDGDREVVRHLREVQHSKNLMLLHAVAEAADRADSSPPAMAAFRSAYSLLALIQAADPGVVAWQLSLPHIGSWAYDCLICLDQGSPPDLGYLTYAAAAAAVRVGAQFELDVPVRDDRVLLPGLGFLHVASKRPWIRLAGDGDRLTADGHIDLPRASLVPDDGSADPVPHWTGTPLVRAVADGQTWDVLLETADRYLDRYSLPMSAAVTAGEADRWRRRIQDSWHVLVRHHGWIAESIAAGVSVIVPLTSRSGLDSATIPTAFGAIATSWPPDPVLMAETLVHEVQHLKLSALMDMLPLIEPCDTKVYAPWRKDPRPAGGLLQGVYAFLGIARFWHVQRQVETEPDDVFRAHVTYERWRPAIEAATSTLLSTGCLTPPGVRLVTMVRDQGRSLESGTAPAPVLEAASMAALDHWLNWQLMHTAVDAAGVASLAAGYRRGERAADLTSPETRIEADTRKIESAIRSRLLNMRYLEPPRYRDLRAEGVPELSQADGLLLDARATAASQAYRDEITTATGPLPDAWIGLALAVNQLPSMPTRQVFATKLPLLFDMHTCLMEQGFRTDPLDLAAWFA